jgi:hypothetical protein
MRELLVAAIATRSASLREAAAEARGLARGFYPSLPTAALDEAVIELGACAPPVPPDLDGQALRPADPAEVADSLA